MKKIALFLTFSLALSSILTAQDVTVNGWLEQKASMVTLSGSNLSDDMKKPVYTTGASTLDLEVNVIGDGWGAHAMLETWAGAASMDSAKAPGFLNTYIYSTFAEMVTVYAGLTIQAINYSPAPVVEGDFFGNDALGQGFGAYNYMAIGNQYTGNVSGLIAEVAVENFTAALAFKSPEGKAMVWVQDDTGAWVQEEQDVMANLQEDEMKRNMIINAKYDIPGTAMIYGGFALGYDFTADTANNGLWLAVSTSMVPGLIADLKFETNLPGDDSIIAQRTISANLGYELEMMKIVSETNLHLFSDEVADSDAGYAEKTMGYSFGLLVTPYLTDVVDLGVKAYLEGQNGKNAAGDTVGLLYRVGLDVSKGIGNVGNTLSIDYGSTTDEDPVGAFSIGYKINIWF